MQGVLLVLAVPLVSFSHRSSPEEVFKKQLQPLIDRVSHFHNVSFSLGIVNEDFSTTITSGLNSHVGKASKMPLNGKFPMGSVTKSWTAIGIMQQYENGLLDIDLPISTYVDAIMMRLNNTNMSHLWNNSPMTVNITARHLMGMRAGLHDYNDSAYAAFTYANPKEDWTPFDILHALNKTFICPPGTCGAYASPGYELLGLALCNSYGEESCSSWEDLDQKRVLDRAGLRSRYTEVAFPERGPCSKDKQIVHQYSLRVDNLTATKGSGGVVVTHADILQDSCLNGWTCGNIAASVESTATWFWDVFHDRFVNHTTLLAMMNSVPLNQGWSPGLSYGLGLMHWKLPKTADPLNQTITLGHGGADWGSIAMVNGFNPVYNFSIAIGTNSVSGMNCSEEYRALFPQRIGAQYSDEFFDDTSCIIYDAVIQTLTNNSAPRLNCTPQFDFGVDFDGSGSSGGGSYDNHWWEGGEGDAGYSNGSGGGLFGSAGTACTSELKKVCPSTYWHNASKAACMACVKVNGTAKHAVRNCSAVEEVYYCTPKKSYYTSNFTCAWTSKRDRGG